MRIGNSSAFGFLLRVTPTFKQSFQRGGCRLCLFTLSSMTNQQGDWSWAELLRESVLSLKEKAFMAGVAERVKPDMFGGVLVLLRGQG